MLIAVAGWGITASAQSRSEAKAEPEPPAKEAVEPGELAAPTLNRNVRQELSKAPTSSAADRPVPKEEPMNTGPVPLSPLVPEPAQAAPENTDQQPR